MWNQIEIQGALKVLGQLHVVLTLYAKLYNDVEVKVQTVSFNLGVFSSISGEQLRNYSPFCTWSFSLTHHSFSSIRNHGIIEILYSYLQ